MVPADDRPLPSPNTSTDLFEIVTQFMWHVQRERQRRIRELGPNRVAVRIHVRIVFAAVQQPSLDFCLDHKRQPHDGFRQHLRLESRKIVNDEIDLDQIIDTGGICRIGDLPQIVAVFEQDK